MHVIDGRKYLDTNETAERLGLSARTLINQRTERRSPMRYVKYLGRVLYPLSEVERYAGTVGR
ncbi:helix-turn-helix domain-containing protein [Micromonospora mirobrigensis]|uniref:Helix-turn-helix domain-containing protein n=1 Tax=Micromonospora mirobrigensis TaxID=262898 RepID=A0A1C5AJ28_9ACTN|nr:helix-turn-helix domain-containing protein [Micromonospora mirobrigensis]SCF45024.1 Helix-turn-helix domain-containing protein [Micromonospora mirobrigensis]